MIIGICGRIGAGKSTLATMLLTELQASGKYRDVYIRPMATELKDITAKLKSKQHILDNYHILNSYFKQIAPFNNTAMARKAALKAVYYHVRYYTDKEKPRKFYQKLGTEVGRQTLGDDVWIRALKQYMYRRGYTKDTVVIVDDIRFDNEARMVDTLILIDIDLNRNQYAQNIAGKSKEYTAPHASENGVSLTPNFLLEPGFTLEVAQWIVKNL